MGKVRVVYRADGGVSIIHPAPKSRRQVIVDNEIHLEPLADWYDRVFTKAMGTSDDLRGREYNDIDESELPQDRKYREAWRKRIAGGGITIDLTKKLEIDERPVYTEEQERQIRTKMREMAIEKLGF